MPECSPDFNVAYAGGFPLSASLGGNDVVPICLEHIREPCAGLVGRWRLHNHPEAVRGLMRSLTR